MNDRPRVELKSHCSSNASLSNGPSSFISNNRMSSSAPPGVTAMVAAIPESVFLPGSETFQNIALSYWAENVVLEPSCVLTPKTQEEMSEALKVIAKNNIPFAIRGGGHNANKGWNNIDGKASASGGILISTAELKSYELVDDEDGQIFKVGVGLPLLDIYEILEGKNITIAAGNTGAPGLGGLLLGGAMSSYWTRIGYSSNYVVNFQVVLGSGEVLEANRSTHPDLYWALKGGLNNFGIVTRMDLRVIKTQNIWSGMHILPPPVYEQAIKTWGRYIDEHGNDPNGTMALISPGPGMVMANLFYDGAYDGEGDQLELFREMSSLPRLKTTFQETNWTVMAKLGIDIAPYGFR